MAVVSHLLKLADGRKWHSRASRWLSLMCHLNGLVQINRWLQTLRSRGSYLVYALKWAISRDERKRNYWGHILHMDGWRDMAISQLPTWAEFLISYGEWVGGLESWAGRWAGILMKCIQTNYVSHLNPAAADNVMLLPCQASDDYGLKLNIFIPSFGHLNYSSWLIVIQERGENPGEPEAEMATPDSTLEAQDGYSGQLEIGQYQTA